MFNPLWKRANETVNPWVGEAAAINEFNAREPFRKIAPYNMLRERRICKNAKWIAHMYALHVHDHVIRTPSVQRRPRLVASNEYMAPRPAACGLPSQFLQPNSLA